MKATHSISALALAFLVLVSSTSVMVGVHRCMGEVQNMAFFSKADGCEKEQSLPPCHRQTAPCCDDETVILQGDDFKASPAHRVVVASPVNIEQPLVQISEVIPAAFLSHIKYRNYDPPLRSSDLLVAHQVFII